MPAIGTIDFDLNDGFDSGIAMLLAKPPEEEIRVKYGSCQLLASPATPYVICRFSEATSLAEAFEKGSFLAQEALDILSVTGRADLITRDNEDEHLLWWISAGRRIFSLVSTAMFSIKVGPITLTVHDAQGNVVPPTPMIPKHHIGFRFYRLAQASDDLYDAYRNMYLAFESLLSSRYPKSHGREIDWLRQSLTFASSDLSLPTLVPPSTPDPIDCILGIIYTGARLPLFHAKDGKAYFAPVQSNVDRKSVTNALNMLTHIVLRMADVWFSARRMSGEINLKILEEQDRVLFDNSYFIFSDNPAFTLKDDLQSNTITNGILFPAKFSEHFGMDIKHNVFGEIPVSTLELRERLHAIFLVNNVSTLIGLSPDTTLDLAGFDVFQVLLFIRSRNANIPKHMYPR